jgi:hypothetical protein
MRLQGSFLDSPEDEIEGLFEEINMMHENSEPLYNNWTDRSKEKPRRLSVPKRPLRIIIDKYLGEFVKKAIKAHEQCHGGEELWSNRKSIQSLTPVRTAFSFDIKEAFINVDISSVYGLYEEALSSRGISEEDADDYARVLTRLSYLDCYAGRGLPIGSPLSMALFNRMMFKTDETLAEEARKRGFRYARWVDDFTIASERDSVKLEDMFGSLKVVERDFPIADKTYFQKASEGNGIIYLLGHRIVNGISVSKNSDEEREKNKSPRIDAGRVRGYSSWEE